MYDTTRRSATVICALALSTFLAAPALSGDTLSAPANAVAARAAGARWLVQHQGSDGGWGAGAFGGGRNGAAPDVATTSLAVMALFRDARGDAHQDAIERGVRFVVEAVEASPPEGPRLRGPDGTQPQYKLGRNVDTHFAALMLGELAHRMPEPLRTRADVAYDRVLTKVVAAQQQDGSFDRDGWAPVLSSSVAAQSLYKAHAMGKKIEQDVLDQSDSYQRKLMDADSGAFDTSAGAGVDLYAAASTLRNNRDAAGRNEGEAKDREEAQKIAEAAARAVREDRGGLMGGFGSIGGEEMLSYMMISDSMAEEGGDDWDAWREKIGAHLQAIQNGDGSWSGHHCITSTTFVTAAAVMTLGSGGPDA